MRRKNGMPESHATHPNVIPLIDVIMCMIVFFMLVARIGVSTGAEQSIRIPVSQLGRQIKDLGNTLVLNVREVAQAPQITAMVEGSQGRPIEVRLVDPVTGRRELAEILRRLRFGRDARPGGAGVNADNDEFKLIIRGEQDMGYRSVEPVLRSAMEASVANVAFQTSIPQVAP